MGSSLNPVNSSLIATALVPIAAAFHVWAGRTAVLVSSLYLASATAQPTAGTLSEVFRTAPGIPYRYLDLRLHRVGRLIGHHLDRFHSSVSDSHLGTIAWIMVAVSVLGVSIVLADRQLVHQMRAEPGGPSAASQPEVTR
jgi:MFS family permease